MHWAVLTTCAPLASQWPPESGSTCEEHRPFHPLFLDIDDVLCLNDRAMWHAGEPFAILDDTYSGPSLKPALMNPVHPFQGRVVLCDEKVGLLPEHVEPLVEALQRPFTGSHAPLEFARHADLTRSALPSPGSVPAVLDTSAQMGATVLVARNFHRRLKTAVHCEASRVKCFGGGLPRIPAVHRNEHLLDIAPPQLNQRRTWRERR